MDSLRQLCIDNIVENIDYWSNDVSDFHLKSCLYIITPFQGLPTDIIQSIINTLAFHKKLNNKNFAILLDGTTESIDLRSASGVVEGKWTSQIARRCSKLKRIELAGCKKLGNKAITKLGQGCQQLAYIDLSACNKVSDEAFIPLIHINLRHLDISGLDKLTDASVQAIANNCPHLEYLNMSSCVSIRGTTFTEIGKNCPSLKHLRISDCWEISEKNLENCIKLLKNLEYLDMTLCQANDNVIAAIATNCHKLHTLILNGCTGISPKCLRGLSKQCKELEHLEFGGCLGIDDFTPLEQNVAPKWKTLNFSNCSRLTDGQLMHLSIGLVKKLYLSGCSMITDLSLQCVARKCQSLEILDVEGDNISDEGLKSLSESEKGVTLKELNVSKCNLITDEGVRWLAKSESLELNTLNLSHCNRITKKAIKELLEAKHSSLKILNLEHCQEINLSDCQSLIAKYPSLTKILWK